MCLTLQLPTLKSAKLSLLGRPLKVLFLLISLFFPCSPFVDVSFKRQTSALAADKEASGRILPPAQAVSEEPFQPSQAVKIQTDDKYDLNDLVKCLGDLDPCFVDLSIVPRIFFSLDIKPDYHHINTFLPDQDFLGFAGI